jgi:hypothetical protein
MFFLLALSLCPVPALVSEPRFARCSYQDDVILHTVSLN